MKTTFFRKTSLAWIAAILALAWACKDDKYASPSLAQQQQNAKAAAQDNSAMIATTQETMDATSLAFSDKGISSGRTADDANWNGCKPNISGTFNVNNSFPDSLIYSGTITLDYGDGSTCKDSVHARSGKITDTYVISVSLRNKFAFSSSETILYEGFHRDTTQLDGTIIIKSATKSPTTVEAQNTKLTYANGQSASWSGTLTFTYEKLHQSRDWWGGKTVDVTGSITGTSRTGVAFSANIAKQVVFTNSCGHHHQFIPVSGTVDVTAGGTTSTVDFGDGSCDKQYTITTNGNVETKTWDKASLNI